MPAVGSASGRVGEAAAGVEPSGPGIGISLPGNPDIERILAESEVFVKYGLLERAADHLARVFDLDAEHRPAREKLITVLKRLGRIEEAARHAELLARPAARYVAQPMSVALGDNDGDDPEADVPTPPPEARMADDGGGETPPPVSLFTDFDIEVRTGDVVIEEREFEISSGAIAHTTLEMPPEQSGPIDDRPLQNLDVDTAANQVTPPPEVPIRTGRTVAPARRSISLEGDDEDPAGSFEDNSATIAGGAAVLSALTPTPLPVVHDDDADLNEDLEQVSFFIEQSLTEEARALLHDLEARFPGHPRVKTKMQQLEAVDARLDAVKTQVSRRPTPLGPGARQPAAPVTRNPRGEGATPPPRAVFEGGEADFATHADLAIAYKEMGLYDAAINELKQLGRDPEREVFALTTMGECYEAKGSFTDAVIRYKRALNCEQISPEEVLALYYLLGAAFDRLGDVSEALYFFEKVAKRAPRFRDIEQKVAELRPLMVKRAR